MFKCGPQKSTTGTLTLLPPSQCMPPHSVSHPDFLIDLANEFDRNGWGDGYPALVGYPWEGKTQLLSGSHRWAAADLARLPWIPVVVHSYEVIDRAWGTPGLWAELMKTGHGRKVNQAKLRILNYE